MGGDSKGDRERKGSRSRDRGRSRSRDRRRSRSRGRLPEAPRARPIDPPGRQMMYKGDSKGSSSGKGGLMESRTINITSGTVTTRLWLKKEMERFGRVEVCHTGNRMNPLAEPPWVRFATTTAAEVALKCISEGQVLVDGVPVTAVMKPTGGGGNRFGHVRETGI